MHPGRSVDVAQLLVPDRGGQAHALEVPRAGLLALGVAAGHEAQDLLLHGLLQVVALRVRLRGGLSHLQLLVAHGGQPVQELGERGHRGVEADGVVDAAVGNPRNVRVDVDGNQAEGEDLREVVRRPAKAAGREAEAGGQHGLRPHLPGHFRLVVIEEDRPLQVPLPAEVGGVPGDRDPPPSLLLVEPGLLQRHRVHFVGDPHAAGVRPPLDGLPHLDAHVRGRVDHGADVVHEVLAGQGRRPRRNERGERQRQGGVIDGDVLPEGHRDVAIAAGAQHQQVRDLGHVEVLYRGLANDAFVVIAGRDVRHVTPQNAAKGVDEPWGVGKPPAVGLRHKPRFHEVAEDGHVGAKRVRQPLAHLFPLLPTLVHPHPKMLEVEPVGSPAPIEVRGLEGHHRLTNLLHVRLGVLGVPQLQRGRRELQAGFGRRNVHVRPRGRRGRAQGQAAPRERGRQQRQQRGAQLQHHDWLLARRAGGTWMEAGRG
mmetsp:Transcript_47819/g.147430  ORF Transcript_47819/g.147430 Transcript_47819/m.147430 type:complete len:482 (-) Transcript_47819:27-1472(-)